MLVLQPMPPGRKPLPFNDPGYLFELKYDGFRALAVVEYGRCTLYSRNGHAFASFRALATRIGNALMPRSLVMHGEIVWPGRTRSLPVQGIVIQARRTALHSVRSTAGEWQRLAPRKIAGQEARTAESNWQRSATDRPLALWHLQQQTKPRHAPGD